MVSLGLTVGRNTPNSLDSPIQVHSTGGRLSTWPPHKGACALARPPPPGGGSSVPRRPVSRSAA